MPFAENPYYRNYCYVLIEGLYSEQKNKGRGDT
jgi:hypothetical protein